MSTLREDDLVQEILAQAQHALAIRAAARQRRHERRWRVALLTLGLLLFAALVLLPGTLADKLTLLVHGVCAQSHQLTIGGTLLPLCIRDTGIYSGFVITCAYLLLRGRLRAGKLPRLPITLALVGFILLLAIDGFNSLLFDLGATTLYPPQNTLRLITGLITWRLMTC